MPSTIITTIPETILTFESTVPTTTLSTIINSTISTTIVTTEPISKNIQTTIPIPMNETIPSTDTPTNIQTNEKSPTTTKAEENITIPTSEVLTSQIAIKTEQELTNKMTEKITEKIKYINETTLMTNEIKVDTKQTEIITNHIDKTENIPPETTINNLPNTTTPIPNKNETILTTIPQIMNTTYIASTEKEIISTIKEISTTLPEIKNEETNVVLLGFSQFKLFKANFTFNFFLTSIKNILYTKHILFPMEIIYNRNIRRLLKETRANCTLVFVESNIKYKYYCHVPEETENIKEVKLIPDFDFVSQNNVTLVGASPLAKMFMNNMIELMYSGKIYDNLLENSFVYILDNSKFIKYDKFLFNVTGEIEDPKSKLDNKALLLMINLENSEKSVIQVQCNISNISRNNYILNCKSNETFKGELQSGVSFIDENEILLLNFADINESMINIEKTENNKRFFMKTGESKLGAGAIVGIIIPIIVIVALIAFLIFQLRKKNKRVANDSDSTIKKFKVSDGIKY